MDGVTRYKLIEKHHVTERSITIEEIHNCEALFVTNSIVGIRRVTDVDGIRIASECYDFSL